MSPPGWFLKRGKIAKYSSSGGRWDHGQGKPPGLWIWVCMCLSFYFPPFLQCFKNTLFQTPSCCNISSAVTARRLHQIKMQSRMCWVFFAKSVQSWLGRLLLYFFFSSFRSGVTLLSGICLFSLEVGVAGGCKAGRCSAHLENGQLGHE